jgi:hypothetical protein
MLHEGRGERMTKLIGTLVVSGAFVLLPAMARAQEDQAEPWSDLGIGEEPETPAPSTAAPTELPPAPQYESPPAPPAQAEAPAAPPAEAPASPSAGQWIYTQQYGWIWMPYSDSYTYAPANGYGEPYAYVYYPAQSCWTWVAAPWVWGFGPWPFFGVFGPARFGWYGHGWWRYPERWHYAPLRSGYAGFRAAPAYRGGAGHGGFRPAPSYRGGAGHGGVRPAPPRAGAGYRGGGFGFVGGGRGHGFGSPGVPAGRGGFAPGPSRGWGHGGVPGFSGRGGSGGHGGVGSGGRGGHGGWHFGRGRG